MPPGFFIVTGVLENAAPSTGRAACYAVVVRANESVSTYKIIFGRSFGSYPTREAGYEALRRGGWTCRPGEALCEFRISCADERLPITIPPA